MKSRKNTIIILLVLIVVILSITILMLLSKDKEKVIEPDYTELEIEENAEVIENDLTVKTESKKGSGSVALNYSNKVNISLNECNAQLMFANPNKSTHDIVVQIYIKDILIAQSGLLKRGNQIKQLDILQEVSNQLEQGIYEGVFKLLFYDSESGEKAMVDTEIPITINVKE